MPDEGSIARNGTRRDRPVVVHFDLRSAVMLVVGLLALLLLLGVARGSSSTLAKVAVGVLIAMAFDPVIRGLQQRFGLTRSTAVAFVGSALLLVFGAIAVLLGPAAIREAREVATDLPGTVEQLYGWPVIGERLERAEAADAVGEWFDDLPNRFDDETVTSLAEAVLGGAATLLVVLVVAIAVMVDGESLVARARRLVPAQRRDAADRVGRIVSTSVGRYFAGSLVVAALNGLVVLSIALLLGVPLAPLAAVWSMITNLIPQIGGALGGSFLVLLALSEGPGTGLIALVVFLAYQQLENHVIAPTIVGRAVNLSPLVTMLAALIGGAAAGVPGALAATPLVGVIKAIAVHVRGEGTLDGGGSLGEDPPST